jgi:hypothetical protein
MLNIDEQMKSLSDRIGAAPADDIEATKLSANILLGELIQYYNEDQHAPRIHIPIGPVSEQKDKPKT